MDNSQNFSMELLPPEGELAMVLTDIKSSTFLWENQPSAMREAIKVHNVFERAIGRS